jgi:hypothetical protein
LSSASVDPRFPAGALTYVKYLIRVLCNIEGLEKCGGSKFTKILLQQQCKCIFGIEADSFVFRVMDLERHLP